MIGWQLIKQAEVALAALDAGATPSDVDFYNGKVAIARWFTANRLPLLAAERSVAEATTLDIMELPESVF